MESLLLLITSEMHDAQFMYISLCFSSGKQNSTPANKFSRVWAVKNSVSLDSFHTNINSLESSLLVKIAQKPRSREDNQTSSQRNYDWDLSCQTCCFPPGAVILLISFQMLTEAAITKLSARLSASFTTVGAGQSSKHKTVWSTVWQLSDQTQKEWKPRPDDVTPWQAVS